LEENAITEDWLSTDDRNYKYARDNFRNEKLIMTFHTHMQEVRNGVAVP